MTDDDESEYDDGELALVEGETLELRMRYLEWCDLAYQRLVRSWAELVLSFLLLIALAATLIVGIILMSTNPSHTAFHDGGLVCVIVGGVGVGGPIGLSIRLLLDIAQDKRIFTMYMRSAREYVVMRRVTNQD